MKLAPVPEDPDEEPEWCEMEAFCSDMTFMVELSCGHKLCLGCFSSYAAVVVLIRLLALGLL